MRTRAASTRSLLGALFVVTGFVSLVAEQVFEKLLGLLVGVSTPASAVVLAVYFAGLTIGAAGYARFLRPRVRSALAAYGLLEGGVALWNLLLAIEFDRMIPIFAVVLRLGTDHFWILQGLRLAVACVWILPPTILMGMTFPAVADALESLEVGNGGRALARFYGLNLLGALAGALAAPYLLFPALGMDGALGVAFLLDGAVCAIALARSRTATPLAMEAARVPALDGPDRAATLKGRALVVVAALSGFLFFALEVIWTHLIGAVLGNSVFAFAAMLAVVLAGLALGGLLMGLLLPERQAVPPAIPAVMFLLGAAALALSHGLWPATPHALATHGGALTSFGAGEMLRLLWAAILLLAPSTVLGMTYPSLFRLDLFPSSEWARIVGRMNAWNAAGSIAGALFAGFLLLPLGGSEASLLLVTGLYVMAGVTVGGVLASGRTRALLLFGGLAVLGLLVTRPPWDQLALSSGEHVYFRPAFVSKMSKLLFFHEDAAGGITTVVSNPGANRPVKTLLTNGKFQGDDSSEIAAQAGFALAPVLSTREMGAALVIGLGTGYTAHVVSAVGFSRVDVVEIAPGIVDASEREFGTLTGNVLRTPGIQLFLEDGRNFLLLHERRYDLITMEIASVWFAGSTNLYSREFYALARSRLRPGGVFQQWIQMHHIGTREFLSAVATVRAVFPQVSVWVLGGQGILVATDGEQLLQPAPVASLVRNARRLGLPEEALFEAFRKLLAGRILAPADTDRLLANSSVPLNTDRNRWFEYATPRFNLSPVPWKLVNETLLAVYASPPRFEAAPGAEGPLVDVARRIDRAAQLEGLGLTEAAVERFREDLRRRKPGRPR